MIPTRLACACIAITLALGACTRAPAPGADDARPAAPTASAQAPADTPREALTAGDREFPAIPVIVVPEIVGVTPAQRALEASMQDVLDPIAGISVRPAHCATDGARVDDAGITSVDAAGNVSRNGDEGIFKINADGSGTANFNGGIVTVNADGSGTINGTSEAGSDDAIVRVEANGAGTYNGAGGIISLDGNGAGTWNGDGGVVTNNGDGSGTWNGPHGIVTIKADGSGTWNADHGLVVNNGDGTGTIGGKAMAMAPLPKVSKAGRFPPLKKFAPPGAPCGFVITLNDAVLFDFDKSDIRPDASKVLDTLAGALAQVQASAIEIGGHTDAKGSDAYNQGLSERRASSVIAALRQRGAAQAATSKGYGETRPVAPNTIAGQDHPGGRQLNRRVEIFVRT